MSVTQGLNPASFERLTPRMRECLRLVYERKSSKKIALVLKTDTGKPLGPSTIDGYLADAVRLLGAADRFDAAEQLHAFESEAPRDLRGENPRVGGDDPIVSAKVAPKPVHGMRLPLRPSGATNNDLTVFQRLFWVGAVAFALAIGFGMLAVGLHVVSDIVSRR